MNSLFLGSILYCLTSINTVETNTISSPNAIEAVNDVDTIFNQRSIRIPILDNDKIEGKIARIIVTPGKFGRSMINLDNTVTYIPNKEICGQTDHFEYLICNQDVCDTALISVYLPCKKITAITGFSPNDNNGKNTFTIMGLDQYPDHTLSIFSKEGNRVFHTKNYKNDWKGTSENQPLETGTYFYVIKTKEMETFQGYVSIDDVQ